MSRESPPDTSVDCAREGEGACGAAPPDDLSAAPPVAAESSPTAASPTAAPRAQRRPPPRVRLAGVSKAYTVSQAARLAGLLPRLLGRERQTSLLALDNVSLDLYPGEFVCLVGPSGSGKTTLLNLVAGLLPPTSGKVTLDGQPITRPGPDRAVVFQSPAILPWKTVLGNISLAPDFAGKPVAVQRQVARDLVELFGLEGFEDHYPSQLSGGLQSRVALACAYAADPAILLMDEPFGSLDILSREHLQDELQRLWQIRPRTTLFVTHDIEEALYLGDRLVVLAGHPGQIMGDFPVPFVRPRDQQLKTSVAFQRLRRDVKAFIRRLETGDAPQALPSVAQVMAEQLDFATSVSHELRTPLTSIRALSELLMEQTQTPEMVQDLAKDIHSESQRIERIAADLLDVSRLDTGQLTLAVRPVVLARLLGEAVTSLAPLVGERRIEVQVAEDLPPVRADALRIRQVLHNLLLNALAYSPHASAVQVVARRGDLPEESEPGTPWHSRGWPVVEVVDRGIGIPEGEQHRIFDKFYRASNAVAWRAGGTGIGLYLARRVVELHGGRIWTSRRSDGGTVVAFDLPPARASGG
ncbi:MAG: ATP-binding cassette domain-containing protein [Chloroflexota bacterium]